MKKCESFWLNVGCSSGFTRPMIERGDQSVRVFVEQIVNEFNESSDDEKAIVANILEAWLDAEDAEPVVTGEDSEKVRDLVYEMF